MHEELNFHLNIQPQQEKGPTEVKQSWFDAWYEGSALIPLAASGQDITMLDI